jgi:hypothetical protein
MRKVAQGISIVIQIFFSIVSTISANGGIGSPYVPPSREVDPAALIFTQVFFSALSVAVAGYVLWILYKKMVN